MATESEITLLLLNMKTLAHEMVADADKHLQGNASAGRRARVASVEMRKMLKKYQELSIEFGVN